MSKSELRPKPNSITLDNLRHYAVARSLFTPTTLPRAINKLGFVQADPIRAPARAQDLTLRHRVTDYRAGDLERRYATLAIEEDFFVNYGFLPRTTVQLMHPRTPRTVWPKAQWNKAHAMLDFVRARGVVHPREVDQHFAHGKVKNWFGGSTNASTQLLDGMHYRGLVRIAGREGGVRTYAASTMAAAPSSEAIDVAQAAAAAIDALIDVIVHKYAPLPERTLGELVSRLLGGGVPQWRGQRAAALKRAKARLPCATIEGVNWLWVPGDNPGAKRYATGPSSDDAVRLLAPFDPIVWCRRRFEMFWGWAYRFEAYTPAPKRVRGYYALPLLWRGQVIGWGNVAVKDGAMSAELGYVAGTAPRDRLYQRELAGELDRMRSFLQLRES